ncbi:hypothetical protein EFM21_00830 [Leuconostoc falkenbergense]|uniref:hypothetical protein n=1 Tax=Leuconostoc falkenbergense TaxID=2766470 RepID=UPI0021AA195D|nr:hypothetical protein [Leuconostoc falkenbergense]MCT4377722.1 hypothetical protein [Leuconostoc falkenbergense]MDV8951888.1 hypothetical protein [Leuconostoc falkenbergense]
MALTQSHVKQWVIDQHLDTWGPVNVTWHDDLKRTVIIVADGTKNQVRQEIEKIVAGNIAKGIISKEDANDFLDSLHVNDYAVED